MYVLFKDCRLELLLSLQARYSIKLIKDRIKGDIYNSSKEHRLKKPKTTFAYIFLISQKIGKTSTRGKLQRIGVSKLKNVIMCVYIRHAEINLYRC